MTTLRVSSRQRCPGRTTARVTWRRPRPLVKTGLLLTGVTLGVAVAATAASAFDAFVPHAPATVMATVPSTPTTTVPSTPVTTVPINVPAGATHPSDRDEEASSGDGDKVAAGVHPTAVPNLAASAPASTAPAIPVPSSTVVGSGPALATTETATRAATAPASTLARPGSVAAPAIANDEPFASRDGFAGERFRISSPLSQTPSPAADQGPGQSFDPAPKAWRPATPTSRRSAAAGVGYSAGLSYAESIIVGRESRGLSGAKNPRSSAFGLGQLLSGNRAQYAPRCGTSASTRNPGGQLCMMRAYINDRYGSAARALAFRRSHGWY